MTDDTKTCPKCAEDVKVAATVCRYCSYNFEPTAVERVERAGFPKLLQWVFLALLLFVGVIVVSEKMDQREYCGASAEVQFSTDCEADNE